MRDGLRTVTELVGRIEGSGVAVDDVSISTADGQGLAVDLSIRLRNDDRSTMPVEDEGDSDAEQLNRGGTDGRTSRKGRTLSPDFGALSASVGGPVAGSIAAGLETVAQNGSKEASDEDAETPAGHSPGRNGKTLENDTASSSSDELVTCRVDGCEETFETDHGMKIHATKAHQAADGSAPSPHRNPERLREVYEARDTFEEMTEALDVDVTPQTVRRSMMRLGVHDPTEDDRETGDGTNPGSDDESTDAPDERTGESDDGPPEEQSREEEPKEEHPPDESGAGASEDEPVDGSDEPAAEGDGAAVADVDELLPSTVDGDAFVGAVREASTLYEVQRRLDMDREEVQTLLAEFGLLDLVHGRVAKQGEREERKAEVERRILERVGDRAGEGHEEQETEEPEERDGQEREALADDGTDDRADDGTDERSDERPDDRAGDRSGEQARAD